MLPLVDLYLIGSFLFVAVLAVLAMRVRDDRADCTIARVLYDVEHLEKSR